MTTSEPATRLSRERILEAALALAEREGLEALSMRRIAQELDVWPMSLYRYFHDKEELLDALADAAAEGIATPAGEGPWREQLARLLDEARRAFARHPGGTRLRLSGSPLTPAAGEVRDSGLAILRRAGLAEDEAERAWSALLSYTAGSAALAEDDGGFRWGLDRLLDGLDAQRATSARTPR